jgi:hypothetical protein
MDEHDRVAEVVRDQVQALREGDWDRAYAHAARAIAERFGPEDFRRMVEGGYAALIESTAEHIEAVEVEGPVAAARLRLVGPDGGLTGARYELALEDGEWRVTGVVLVASLSATVSLNGHRPGGRIGG